MTRPRYGDLYFGLSDSRNEANQDRDSFLQTYVDLNGSTKRVVRGDKFLVLGPKGTGKSALAWYLQFAEPEGAHLALVRDASSLPLAEVPRLQTGQEPGPERTVVAWKFILLCNYLELLMRDQGCSINRNPEVVRVARLLRDFGFMGDASGRALLKFSTTTVTIPVPKLGTIYKRESSSALNIFNLIPYLEMWVAEAESAVRHILLIDGLDSIFLNDAKYDESLSSLVQAAYTLNQKLMENRATGSVVLLLRNDIFSRIALSLPDSQKMRDDLALELDWRVLSGKAGVGAPLMRLVNTKAGRALGVDNFEVLKYFPDSIEVGSRELGVRKIPTFQYLLNMTRHTPRDMLRLFEEIRRVEASGIFEESGDRLRQEVIHEGVLQYSTKYFVGAISNEFAGYAGGPERAAAALTALKAINKQSFDGDEFRESLASVASGIEVDHRDLLRLLFYAGAIGNSIGGYREKSYMQFYHRRDESEIYLQGNFMLHNALIHAWGLRRTLGNEPESQTGAIPLIDRGAARPRRRRRKWEERKK
ncbi:P-loop ATPase, Sll1717 family [Cellulomonas sp. S1-8]|uniref:P-loop ATPase, Sll1717 family n=1 Tax=Cellulomonas sp. S1-8 TaxID=2904790 RepID=UPI0022434FA9|nr:hypothetical protein [Cellulomonas sp. S1-8]UZN02954.1 hypothetical protein OKX07_18170 [Cellulomonas sp. S1-8]